MGLFSSKSKDKDIEVNFSMVDGIPGIPSGFAVAVGVDNDRLTIRKRASKEEPYSLSLSKLTNVSILTDKEILEKQKSVGGRAVVGALVLGPLGAIVGGMSGIGTKKKTQTHTYLIINYFSEEEKVLSFEIVGASLGWDKLYQKLKTFIPEQPIQSKEL